MLARLEGQVSPEDLFTTVPGLGEELARRIHTRLGIETLASSDGITHDVSLMVRGTICGRQLPSLCCCATGSGVYRKGPTESATLGPRQFWSG